MSKKLSEDRLEKSRKMFLEPRIAISLDMAIKSLHKGEMTQFIQSIMLIDRNIEHHIINNCTRAENENIRIDCITAAENMRIKHINKLAEGLVEKCGGQMHYLDEEDSE